MRTFLGYRRPDGRVGVRNHVLVLPTVVCANAVVERIAKHVPEVVAVTHPYGCTLDPVSNEEMTHILAGIASNPNVYGAILVALGCETVLVREVAAQVAETGKPVKVVSIESEGDTVAATEIGIAIAECLVRESKSASRVGVPLSELIVALECGASDAFSGLTANPAVGRASDILVGLGATVILSEVTEFLGAEHILADQAADAEVRSRILALVARTEEELSRIGPYGEFSDITPGNIAGGLTTIEQKSLGGIRKGGTTPVHEVVGYGQRPSRSGLVIMDTPGHDIALNMKAMARRAAKTLGMSYKDSRLIVAHMGGGGSVSAHVDGRMVDLYNCDKEGPFAAERAGGLPTLDLVNLCYSGRYSKEEVLRMLVGGGGLMSHLNTRDIREIEGRIESGDKHAEFVLRAMTYQFAKAIASFSATLEGKVDAIVITGGMAYSSRLVEWIKSRVSFIADVLVFPGENELEALALGVLRVLRNEEPAKVYE